MSARERLETPCEAAERRQNEVQKIIAEQIPQHSRDISFGFVKRDFVEAVISAHRRRSCS